MKKPYMPDPYSAINYPLQAAAFREAHEIMGSRNGAGFIFRVRTSSGDTVEGPTPSDAEIDIRKDGILAIEHGGNHVFIADRAIESITVIEC